MDLMGCQMSVRCVGCFSLLALRRNRSRDFENGIDKEKKTSLCDQRQAHEAVYRPKDIPAVRALLSTAYGVDQAHDKETSADR